MGLCRVLQGISLSNIDFDDADKKIKCKCVDIGTMTLAELIELIETRHAAEFKELVEKINEIGDKLDTFMKLHSEGKMKCCNNFKKPHWAMNNLYSENRDICDICHKIAIDNSKKHKQCKHGKRIAKDRTPCKECAAEITKDT